MSRPNSKTIRALFVFFCVSSLIGIIVISANFIEIKNIQNRINSINEKPQYFIGVGDSMYPTIKDGDISVATSNFSSSDLERGCIIAFSFEFAIQYDSSYNFDSHPSIVTKRIIGLPGDTLYYDETTSTLYVNGASYPEPYIFEQDYEWNIGRYTVPEKSYFVMGDNRNISMDSRTFGCVPEDQITHIITEIISDSDLKIYISS